MKTKTKKNLKWTGIILGSWLLIIISFGIHMYSLIPNYEGECPPLQTYMFSKPETNLPIEGKYIYKSATELAAMMRNHEATSYDIEKEFIAICPITYRASFNKCKLGTQWTLKKLQQKSTCKLNGQPLTTTFKFN